VPTGLLTQVLRGALQGGQQFAALNLIGAVGNVASQVLPLIVVDYRKVLGNYNRYAWIYAFAAIAFLSVFWSAAPSVSMRAAIQYFTQVLCALIAAPRRPHPGNEVAELVYIRLLGRQQWLVLLAAMATAALFIALAIALPQRGSMAPETAQVIQQVQPAMARSCYSAQQDPTNLGDIAGPPTSAGKPRLCRP